MVGKVAVVTRTKNRNLLLERALKSVLEQTYDNYVHVVVNDGGDSEKVDRLLDKYEDQYKGRLVRVHNEQSLGMEAASNKGIKAVDSEYVVIHDDDDSWENTFLEMTVKELENNKFPSVKGVVTHTTQVFESIDGGNVKELWRREFDPWLSSVSLPMISEINKFMPISFIYERSVFDEIGYYDESLPVIGDWEFNIRFFSKYDIVVIKECLANYYIREKAEKEAYSNTVTAGKDAHLFYRDIIVNKHIRNDLESGSLTMGMLMAYGDYFHRSNGNTWRIVQILERLKNNKLTRVVRKVLKI